MVYLILVIPNNNILIYTFIIYIKEIKEKKQYFKLCTYEHYSYTNIKCWNKITIFLKAHLVRQYGKQTRLFVYSLSIIQRVQGGNPEWPLILRIKLLAGTSQQKRSNIILKCLLLMFNPFVYKSTASFTKSNIKSLLSLDFGISIINTNWENLTSKQSFLYMPILAKTDIY